MAASLSWLFLPCTEPPHDAQCQHILAEWQNWDLCDHAPGVDDMVLMTGGLTNRSWALTLDSGEYVVRLSAANSQSLDICRETEYRIQQRAAQAGLAPRIRYRSADDSYWIVDRADGPELSECMRGSISTELMTILAQQLIRLHTLPFGPDLPELHVAVKAEHYWRAIEARWPGDWSQQRLPLQHLLAEAPGPERALCHMDPNPLNWRLHQGRWILIDWEYAAVGHPCWDIAGLAVSANMKAEQQQQWCALFGIDVMGKDWQRALLQEHYFAVLWYGVQGMIDQPRLVAELDELHRAARQLD
ncbi:phosphotransferase [Oceanobacter sp. 5_MG-2023]|uniref:phosphotransferase n=1 Tax=Oceanobacter sp. 5_MG-2023 TaxID=3062645 RepID=UPI0026E1C896|nr:phosphotransferase [Oceanobacter sp. 5_MG-2023]MDO6680710.1 phosphotransferase [Oceanobacter sp. 5_MG-2023]